MSSPRDACTAAFAIEMRAPLARIELGASQLARDASTPAARDLASGIRSAVSDLDRLIGRMLSMLLPVSPAPRPPEDLFPVLEDLHARLAPVLRARGVAWKCTSGPDVVVDGDPDLLRAAAMGMLRVGADLASGGGRLALALLSESDQFGLRLAIIPPTGRSSPAVEQGFSELSGWALERGGRLAIELNGAAVDSILWFPRSADPCAAS